MPTHLPLDSVIESAASAIRWLRTTDRSALLDAIAGSLSANRDSIIRTTADETALTPDELAPEFDRMVGTLAMFADVLREGSWLRAAIDPHWRAPTLPPPPHSAPIPNGCIGPNHDVRRMLIPLPGVVAVFGASNFPLAYGVCGGDTASALAAGCPVVVKEHPAHVKTGRLLARIAADACRERSGPKGVLGYIPDADPGADFRTARDLVSHPSVVAVGFTGSPGAGLALDRMARERPTPIPVFAEMGSTNLVLVTRDAATQRPREIADELAASILSRFGQQCTNTGLILLDAPDTSATDDRHPFFARLRESLLAGRPRRMLSPAVHRGYRDRLNDLAAAPETDARMHAPPHTGLAPLVDVPAIIFARPGPDLFDSPRFRAEIFGPACIASTIDLSRLEPLIALLRGVTGTSPWGALVASVYLGETIRPEDRAVVEMLQHAAGRLVINGPPTGVRVSAGTVHAGPFPATNRPDATAVGPLAIERWCRPVCFQNCPEALLPPELRDANPLNLVRLVNGSWTRDAVRPSSR
ncbi:MAG: aldehyde dehydrogenase family protein [Phycisphaeraceae bacterium]|nr:aldehyde dehydrogenase family protein [Phycisphaeraceae bacterium]